MPWAKRHSLITKGNKVVFTFIQFLSCAPSSSAQRGVLCRGVMNSMYSSSDHLQSKESKYTVRAVKRSDQGHLKRQRARERFSCKGNNYRSTLSVEKRDKLKEIEKGIDGKREN